MVDFDDPAFDYKTFAREISGIFSGFMKSPESKKCVFDFDVLFEDLKSYLGKQKGSKWVWKNTKDLKKDCLPPKRWTPSSKELGIKKGFCEEPTKIEVDEKKGAEEKETEEKHFKIEVPDKIMKKMIKDSSLSWLKVFSEITDRYDIFNFH